MLRQLTNLYLDCKLVNLAPDTPGGPYVVSQMGYDPTDPRFVNRLFLLQRDGTWIDQITHATLPPDKRSSIVFETLPEVMETLGQLPGEPRIIRREVSAEELRGHIASLQQDSAEGLVRRFLAEYRAGRR